MKIKVLKSNKTQFPSYWAPVTIVVKGEEEKGAQKKGLNVYFSKVADKKLPVDFKGGIIEVKSEDINAPYIYEIKQTDEGKDDYPFIYIKDIVSISPLKPRANTCTFLVDEEDTSETSIEETPKETKKGKQVKEEDLPDDDLPF